jgi:hypothetical protein
MAYIAPTVNHSATNNGTYTTLTGVQSVNINRGRQRFQDPFPQSSCTVELIPANSYALPLAIGQFIDVRDINDASSPCYFTGQITDVNRTYDIPYNSGTGSAPGDRITITATGGTGALGSAQLNNYSIPEQAVSVSLDDIVSNEDVLLVYEETSVFNSAQTLNGAVLNAVNTLLQTAQLLIDDADTLRSGTRRSVYIYPNTANSALAMSYSDTGATRYKTLQYESSAQSTFNWVEVEATGVYTSVTALGSPPFNALKYTTFNRNLADTSSLSNYLYALLSGQLTPVPFTLSTDTATDANCMNVARMIDFYSRFFSAIGQVAQITFRGTTVSAQVQGLSANFYPDRGSVQLFFSPSLGVPFTLDSASFGVLNTNRLGYP